MAERERVWSAHIHGDTVIARHYAVLAPGEDLTEDPPTVVMSREEWALRRPEFNCNLDGSPLVSRPGVGNDPMDTARRALDALSPQDRATVCAEPQGVANGR